MKTTTKGIEVIKDTEAIPLWFFVPSVLFVAFVVLPAGCGQPLTAPGTVAPHLGESNAPLVEILSRLEKAEARVGTVEASLSAVGNRVATVEATTHRLETTSQPVDQKQQTGAWGIAIGNVNVDGLALLALAGLAVVGGAAVLLARSRGGYRSAVDALVSVNEDRGLGREEAERIQQKAVAHGAEKYLRARVNARRKRRTPNPQSPITNYQRP